LHRRWPGHRVDLNELDLPASGDDLLKPRTVGLDLRRRGRRVTLAQKQALNHHRPDPGGGQDVGENLLEPAPAGNTDFLIIALGPRIQLRPYLAVARVEEGQRLPDRRAIQDGAVRQNRNLEPLQAEAGLQLDDRPDDLPESRISGRLPISGEADVGD